MRRLKVVIADDHPLFRRGLRDAIEELEDTVIVGEVGDGAQAVAAIMDLAPDVAIIDLAMPKMDGFAVVEWMRDHAPQTAAVIITMYNEPAYLDRAKALGVQGFLVKDDAMQDVLACLDAIRSGRNYVSPRAVAGQVVPPPPLSEDVALLDKLTPVQREVLRGVAEHKTSREIGEALGISFRTVQNHRAHAAQTLGLKGANKLLEFVTRVKAQL